MSIPRTRAGRLAFIALSLAASQALAADRFWNGNSGTDSFASPFNWAGFIGPGAGDRAYFASPASTRSFVKFDTNSTIADLYISGTTVAGNWNFGGSASPNGLTVTNSVTINNTSGATPFAASGAMRLNAGTFSVGADCTAVITGAGTSVSTSAQFTMSGNSVVSVESSATLGGYIDAAGTGLLQVTSATLNANGLEVRGGGVVDIRSGSTMTLSNDAFGLANDASIRVGQLRLQAGANLNFNGSRTMEVSSTGQFNLYRSWALPAGGTLNIHDGGDVTSNNYLDIGNGVTGTALIDGAGSTFTATDVSDWGSNAGGFAGVTLTNSASASLLNLYVARNSGSATVNVFSNSTLNVGGILQLGGGTIDSRPVEIQLNTGNLNVTGDATFSELAQLNLLGTSNAVFNGAATFNNKASLSVAGTSIANFKNGATFNTGSTLTYLNGLVSVASGKTLSIAGGVANVTGGGAFSNAATLSVTNGGKFTSASFLDFASGSGTRSATLSVSGANSVYTTATNFTDFGRDVNNTATATFASNAVGNFNAGMKLATGGGTATINVNSAATLNVANVFTAGGSATSVANVNLAGGTLNFTTDALFTTGSKFNFSSGTLGIASGKSLTLTGTSVGTLAGSFSLSNGATLNVTNGGTLNAANFIDIGSLSGATRTGALNVTGTGATYTNLGLFTDIARYVNNTGTATFAAGGTASFSSGLQAGVEGGTATINLNTGGTLNVGGSLVVGGVAASVANFNLAGGTLNLTGSTTIGQGGKFNYTTGTLNIGSGKTFTVNKGIATVAVNQVLDNGSTLSISNGGALTSSNYFDVQTATLLIEGSGSTFVAGGLQTDWGANPSNTATITVSNGGSAVFNAGLRMGISGGTVIANVLSAGTIATHNSALSVGGASSANVTVNVGADANLGTVAGSLTIGQGAKVNLSNSGTIFVDGTLNLVGNGKITSSSLNTVVSGVAIQAKAISMTETAQIDLSNRALSITYAVTAPLDVIRTLLLSGYNNGAQNGPGIVSSYLTADTRYRVGYKDFGSVSSVKLVALTTLAGDATLDGRVNFDDLVPLAQNYNKTTNQFWQDGDFNYDGRVNFDDLVPLAQNYNAMVPGLLVDAGFSAEFVADWALAQSLVPEPTTIFALMAATPLAMRRRRA